MRFTVHRPPTGEVSPCGHRPSGGDVTCSIDVGVAPSSSAGFALENRLALAVPRSDVPARGASLRRVRSRHLLDPAVSLVLQACNKLAPAASADCAIEPPLLSHAHTGLLDGAARGARHRPRIKGLDSDHVEPPCEVGSGFFHPVLAPISFACLQSRDRPFDLLASTGAELGAGEPLLQHLQSFRLTRCKTGCVKQFAGRQSSRHRHAAIDPHHAAVTWTSDRMGNVRERDMPASSPITLNPVRLDTVRHRPRQAKPHPTNLRYPYAAEAAVQPLDMVRLHGDLPKPFMHAGLAPRRTAMRSVKEVSHRLGEIAQRLLLHRVTSCAKPPVFSPNLRQLRALLDITGSLAARLPVLLLLHRQIPHIPRIPTMRQQALLLLGSRQQSEPGHTRTVIPTTDNRCPSRPSSVESGFLPGVTSQVPSRRKHQ